VHKTTANRARRGAKSGSEESLWRDFVFVDADVVVQCDSLSRVASDFGHSDISAVFGSYDAEPSEPLRLRNTRTFIITSYTASRIVPHVLARLGAVRRSAFRSVNGLTEALHQAFDRGH